ncbi:mycothiol transferase [Amycolatopsis pigmentata]|uniref:DinB family protein n=1 Tax=Amycolatopsis pigmentata TaxID=450801 RepID=A0ABW5G8H8_9PSEU
MNFADLLIDGFGRVRESVHGTVRSLNAGQLAERLAPEANSIAWLIWHLTRVQDDHFAELQGTEQVWLSQGWYEKFALPLEPADTGYGHSVEDVAAVRVGSAKLLTDYHDAVHAQTVAWLGDLKETDLDRIVDESWDPPVSLGVRVISVLDDDLEHAGQAAFVRGILQRR